MTSSSPPSPPAPWVERIIRVLAHIRAHLDDELSPEPLATAAGFSLHHFHRVFRGMVGQSIMEYIRDQRLERAAFRLKYGAAPVTQVAFDAGYGSHEAFTRAFRARFDAPPSTYRDQAREHRDGDVVVTLRREHEQSVLCWRHNGAYDGATPAWNALLAFAGAHQLFGSQTRILGFVHDDPDIVPVERLRYDAAITLDRDQAMRLAAMPLPPDAKLSVLPAGQYALALHVGPYEMSGPTYVGLLGKVLPRRGVELAPDPIVELYLNSPMDTAPDALRTEILVRIAS